MTFADHENWVRCVRVHPSGAYILSCSDDRTIRILDVTKVNTDENSPHCSQTCGWAPMRVGFLINLGCGWRLHWLWLTCGGLCACVL